MAVTYRKNGTRMEVAVYNGWQRVILEQPLASIVKIEFLKGF